MELVIKLLELRTNATPGTWGPTTRPPYYQGPVTDENKFFRYGVEGERGEPAWGAIVSDQNRGPGKDHDQFAPEDSDFYHAPGTDMYGGTLVGESLFPGNGEYIAALHNNILGIVNALGDLRIALIKSGVHPRLVDAMIKDSIENV